VLAVTGIALTSLGRASDEVAAGGRLASSTFFGLLSALGFGGFFAFMDAAGEGDVPWALLVARLTAVTAFVAAMLLRRAPLVVRSAQLPAIVSIGVLIVGADSMYAISSTMGLLGGVAVLSSLYPVVTVALARVNLHERIERLRQIGIAACLSGVAAISGRPVTGSRDAPARSEATAGYRRSDREAACGRGPEDADPACSRRRGLVRSPGHATTGEFVLFQSVGATQEIPPRWRNRPGSRELSEQGGRWREGRLVQRQ
jgi:EamA-like transporter family